MDIPGGTVVEYVNDPFGRRIAKKVNGNIVEKYLWQGQTRLLAVCDGWNNLLCRFVYADGRTPAAMEQGGRIFYLSYDQVGSLRQVTDSSGRAVKVLEYDSFGNIIKDSAPGFFLPIGFAGGLLDRHTGLVRFGYRDYYSQIGRWTAKDPIGFAAGDVDLFGYVQNNPIMYIDPNGEMLAQVAGALIGGAVNSYTNYSAHKSGQISGTDYAKAIAFGAGVGILSSFAPGIVSAAFAGGISSGINNINSQLMTKEAGEFSTKEVASAIKGGATIGGFAGVGARIGGNIIRIPNQIGKVIGSKSSKVINYGAAGGIAGTAGGTVLATEFESDEQER